MEKVESECEKPPIPSPFKSALKSVAPYLAFACFVLLVLSILLFQPNQGYMSTGWVSLPILFLASFASFYAKWPLLFKKEKDKFKGDGARRFSFFRHLNMSVGLLAVFWLFFPLIGGGYALPIPRATFTISPLAHSPPFSSSPNTPFPPP